MTKEKRRPQRSCAPQSFAAFFVLRSGVPLASAPLRCFDQLRRVHLFTPGQSFFPRVLFLPNCATPSLPSSKHSTLSCHFSALLLPVFVDPLVRAVFQSPIAYVFAFFLNQGIRLLSLIEKIYLMSRFSHPSSPRTCRPLTEYVPKPLVPPPLLRYFQPWASLLLFSLIRRTAQHHGNDLVRIACSSSVGASENH